MTTNTPDQAFTSDAIAHAIEFWRDGTRMSEVPHEVLENVAASHEMLRRELDELRSAARRYLACSWNDFGEAHAALRSLVGVEDTTEEKP